MNAILIYVCGNYYKGWVMYIMNSKISISRNSKIPYNFVALNVIMLLVIFLPRSVNFRYIIILALVILSFFADGVKTKYLNMNLGMFIYAGTFIISEVIHLYSGSLKDIFVFLTMFVFLRYIIFVGLGDMNRFLNFLEGISIFSVIYGILGIIEAFTTFNIFDLIFDRSFELVGANTYRYGIYRGHGVCTISINNGMLLVFFLCITGYLLFNHISKRRKILTVTYFVLLVAIGLNLSRMVWLVAIATQCIIAVKCGMSWILKRVAIVLAIFIILLPILGQFIETVQSFLQSMFLSLINLDYMESNSGAGGIGERLMLWSVVFEKVKDSKVFGVGFMENFSVQMTTIYGSTITKESIEIHWLYVLWQKGLFGMIGFIIYQISCLVYCWKRKKQQFEEQHFSFNFLMVVVSISYFAAIFSFAGFEDLYFFYIMFSICEAYNNILKKESSSKTGFSHNKIEEIL